MSIVAFLFVFRFLSFSYDVISSSRYGSEACIARYLDIYREGETEKVKRELVSEGEWLTMTGKFTRSQLRPFARQGDNWSFAGRIGVQESRRLDEAL